MENRTYFHMSCTAFRTSAEFVSTTWPPITISSNMVCTCSQRPPFFSIKLQSTPINQQAEYCYHLSNSTHRPSVVWHALCCIHCSLCCRLSVEDQEKKIWLEFQSQLQYVEGFPAHQLMTFWLLFRRIKLVNTQRIWTRMCISKDLISQCRFSTKTRTYL